MTVNPQSMKPMKKIAAPAMLRHPSLDLWMFNPSMTIRSNAKPMMMPEAIWNGKSGVTMRLNYSIEGVR